MANQDMVVCGIDPGLETTGYAVLQAARGSCAICDAGALTTDPRAPLPQRLAQLDEDFAGVLGQWQPAHVGVEQLYAHYKHPRTAIQMGHARGVLMAAAHRAGAEVESLAATRIKKHLTGNGRASKVQVQRAIQVEFSLDAPPEPNDVADALAIALCLISEITNRIPEAAS